MLPILFHIGPIPIRAYGFMVFCGFLIALWYTRRRAAERMKLGLSENPVTPDHVSDYALKGLWFGIIGARALYVIMDWWEFRDNPIEVFSIWKGGMGAYGAIVGGLLYMIWYCKRRNLSFFEFADLAAPGIALVYGIGRIGCFLNGCCYGAPTDGSWGFVFIRDGHPDKGLTPPSQPTQLYSAAINICWFFLLDWWSRRPHRMGEIFLGYVGLFLVYRFILEQFRKGYTADVFVLGMTHAQLFNLILLPFVLAALYRLRRRSSTSTSTSTITA